MPPSLTVRVQAQPFDLSAELAALTGGRTDVGGIGCFVGTVRDSAKGRPIVAMTLEHYPDMAEAEIGRHAETALSRWPLTGLTVIHRVGRITPGENIVLVLTASAHRQAAFEAAEFLMDYLKANAPFWKSEESARGKSWIEARDHDDAAAARWTKS